MKKLKKEGIITYAFIGPILPYLTDLEDIFEKVSPYVDYFKFEDLNMSPCRSNVFKTIRENFPKLEDKYNHLNKEFWISTKKEIEKLNKNYDKPVTIFFKSLGSLKF